MTRIVFRAHDGAETTLDVPDGWSLMQAATANGVDGILGECGGSCACATCHCYVEERFASVLPPASPNETDMLANAAAPLQPTSRLACQVKVSPGLEGCTVSLPQYQE